LRRILVGYDGSEESERALKFALDNLEWTNVEIHIAYVVQKPAGLLDPVPEEELAPLRKAGQDTLSNAARMVRQSLENPVTHLENGNPGEKLVELAGRLKPDLVVVGTIQHSASEKILGTVSSYFLKSRRYPLLIVP
jgi:nucleotide-binding universal stress UspA family protein